MLEKSKFNFILDEIEKIYPDASCELNYRNIYELSVAVILSAQTTDKKVNIVTKELFKKYSNIEQLANGKEEDLKEIIKPLGLASSKSKNLILMAKKVVESFDGIIPSNINDLLTLNGIGRKCANVILCEGYNIPAFPVDTHIERISKRMNLVDENASVLEIENTLIKMMEEERYHKAHHLLIHFGRYFCTARSPKCDICFYNKKCCYNKN